MRWNWFCPMPPAKTGIADYNVQILPFLTAHADVTIWTAQPEWKLDPIIDFPVRNLDPHFPPWEELNRADLNIYHLGNQPDFHGWIWEVSRSLPGLVVLHDLSLHHFFGALYRDRWKKRREYLHLMRCYYGEGSQAAAVAFYDQGFSTEFMAEHFPLTWHALENALGVVVHSFKTFAELKEKPRLAVAYLPLPYAARDLAKCAAKSRRNDFVQIVLFGFLGRNRRLESILRAIASLPRRERVRLDICGEVNDPAAVALIDKLGLGEIVRVRGFLTEEALDEALACSDLALNLRYPSMGEASLSQLRLWEHALPTIVTQVDWYATLPQDTVCFVQPERELEDIQKHLNGLLDDPERFEQIGYRGRKLLETNHSPETYAKTLAEFATSLPDSTTVAVDRLAQRVGRIAGPWLKEDADLGTVRNAARQILAVTGQE